MRSFDVRCPICGQLNKSLLLEDSDGWMECEGCGGISRVRYRERLMCSGNERVRHLRREEKRKTA